MSSNVPFSSSEGITAPTPQNTPLTQAPIAMGLSRPTVPDISEDGEGEVAAANDGSEGLNLAGLQPHMLNMVRGRLADLVGKSSGYIENLPNDVKLNVEGLKGLQEKQNELFNEYKKECFELEKKYVMLQTPLYERRKAIITGKSPATAEEIEEGEKASLKEDEDYTALTKDVPPSSSGIPEFWLTALRNHIGISENITDRDADALKHLIDIRLEYLNESDENNETEGGPGYKIIFHFEKNDFFHNETLEKSYVYSLERDYSGDFVYERAIGTKIKWKEDKDLTKEFEIKKQRNKNTNRTRLIKKSRSIESFFNFFTPPQPPPEDEVLDDDYENEYLDALDEKIEEDYRFGEDLKEKVIPRAIDFFTGKALQYFEDDDDLENDDEDDENDDSEGYDDVSDSDENVPVTRRHVKGRISAATGTKPEECKQQ